MTPLPGDDYPGDHAAKYETSVALALAPEWVRLERLTPCRDPALITLPDTLRRDGRPYDPSDALSAIWGDDPRMTASAAIGQRLVMEITGRLVERVSRDLREVTGG